MARLGLFTATTMNRSPDRNTFQRDAYIARCREEGHEPNSAYLNMFEDYVNADLEFEKDTSQHVDNLEYDLRTTKWICDKAKASEAYAQNVYAAMCNQSWQKNDVWPRLKDKTWSCTWRYAGGIVADMIETGDYIDWYCSGIRGGADEQDLADMTDEDRAKYHWCMENFVSEGTVTDEIREDFFKLGWIPVDNDD